MAGHLSVSANCFTEQGKVDYVKSHVQLYFP